MLRYLHAAIEMTIFLCIYTFMYTNSLLLSQWQHQLRTIRGSQNVAFFLLLTADSLSILFSFWQHQWFSDRCSPGFLHDTSQSFHKMFGRIFSYTCWCRLETHFLLCDYHFKMSVILCGAKAWMLIGMSLNHPNML